MAGVAENRQMDRHFLVSLNFSLCAMQQCALPPKETDAIIQALWPLDSAAAGVLPMTSIPETICLTSISSPSPLVFVLSTNLRQFYSTSMTMLCFLVMVGIASTFIIQRIVDEVRMGSGNGFSEAIANHASVQVSYNNMRQNTAMVLTFCYAACAWMMTNGIVLNPRSRN